MTTDNLPNPTWQTDGPVPTVALDDLKRVFAIQMQATARHPGEPGAIALSIFERACTSGSDAETVWYRVSWLQILQHLNEAGQIDFPWIPDGKPDEAVLKALAVIPMTGMNPTVMRQGFPFDVEELRRLVQKEI
jgi:hypothetical protein